MDMYREEILEHWRNPLNFGKIEGASLTIDQVNPLCGDQVTFYFKFVRGPVSSFLPASARSRLKSGVKGESSVDLRAVGNPSTTATPDSVRMAKGEWRIADVKFTGNGCAISIAVSSMLSNVIKGKKVKELRKLTGQNVLELIGGEVAPARLKCAFLSLEVIRKISINDEGLKTKAKISVSR